MHLIPATVVSEDNPVIVDSRTNHLLYGAAIGLRVLVSVR